MKHMKRKSQNEVMYILMWSCNSYHSSSFSFCQESSPSIPLEIGHILTSRKKVIIHETNICVYFPLQRQVLYKISYVLYIFIIVQPISFVRNMKLVLLYIKIPWTNSSLARSRYSHKQGQILAQNRI